MEFDLLTVIIYVILIFVIIYVLYAEFIDFKCRNTTDGQCGPLTGRAYIFGKPEPGDSKQILLDKVRLTAKYDMNSIYWRRSIFIAIISVIIIGYIWNSKLPNVWELLTGILVIYILVYLSYALFQQWVATPAINQMEDLITALSDK